MSSINRKLIDFGSMSLMIAGASEQLVGFTDVSWKTAGDSEYMYGKGNKPYGWGRGSNKYSGSMTLYYDEVLRLKLGLETKNLAELKPFDLIVSFSYDGVIMNKVVLEGCLISEDGFGMKQGDKSASVTLPFVCFNIKE